MKEIKTDYGGIKVQIGKQNERLGCVTFVLKFEFWANNEKSFTDADSERDRVSQMYRKRGREKGN